MSVDRDTRVRVIGILIVGAVAVVLVFLKDLLHAK